MREYKNRHTGEILTEPEALKQWAEEYDGGDDTNPIPFSEHYAQVCYVYGMKSRGFSPMCQPMDGLLDSREDYTGDYYCFLIYNRQLTPAEVLSYDLKFICTESEEML